MQSMAASHSPTIDFNVFLFILFCFLRIRRFIILFSYLQTGDTEVSIAMWGTPQKHVLRL